VDGFSSEQIRVFILMYVAYASYYLARLNFSIALPEMGEELLHPKLSLGLIGGAFSICYAAGQLVHGQLADRLGAKRIILLGLVLSAIANALFGQIDFFTLMIVIWGMNGYAQSTGWPAVVKILSSWFRTDLGKVGGFFGSCFLVGNLVAWPVLGYIVANFGWRASFLAPPLVLISMACLLYWGVSDRPEEAQRKAAAPGVKSGLRQILRSKRLVTIALAYVLLQFVRSGLSLWAPSYLFERYDLSLDSASYGAAVIPLGGIVGSMISGWLSDRMRRYGRALTMSILILSLSLTLLAFYYAASYSLQVGLILMFLLGLTFYGPHVLMVTVIPMEHEESHGGAGVAGFIDGMGYIGSTFSDPFTGWIVDTQGWNGAMGFWLVSSLAAAFLTFALWIGERSVERSK